MIEIFFVWVCVEIHMEISQFGSEAKIKLISFWFYALSYNEWKVLQRFRNAYLNLDSSERVKKKISWK